jgi:phage terminase large subunit-like protein
LLATKKEQAKICYDNVTVFRKQNIEIQKRCKEIYADGSKYIFSPDNNGTIKYLSSSKNGLQGKNPTWAFLDEAQEVKDMSVIEAVRTGMATRKQPMFVSMSTAGVTPNSAYHSQYSQIEAMCEQKKFDDKLRVFFAVFEIDIDDSIDDKKCWIKANPALLDGRPKLEFLEKEYELAKIGEDNRSLPTFIAFHLNRSCDDASSFYDTNEIKNGRREITSELYYDTYAVLGVDLSTTTDLTCCSCLIPYKHEDEDNTYSFITLQRYFMPKNRLEKNSNTDKVIYNNFTMTKSKDEVCQNLLHLSQGDCVNYSDIVDFILELRDKYKIAIVKIGYDLALSSQFVCRMIENGFSVEEKKFDGNKKLVSRSIGELTDIRQGKYLSEPIKQSKMLFEQGRIFYDTTNALLPYCCSNAKVLVDKDGRYEIVKKESRGRIDGIISWLTAYQAFLSVKDTSFEVEILPYEKMTTQRSWFGKIKEKL